MGKEIQVRIVLRHNTTTGWAEVEEKEVLRKGEIGLEFSQSSNIPKMKIGDGVKPWKGLPYFSADLPETFNWGLLKGTLFEGETEKIEEGSFAGLTKPAYKDNADISVINKNFDILKTNIEELQNKTSSIESTISNIDEAKVDKVSGKGLSTNDYTTDEKNKLAGIATGATKVIVDSALSSTSTNAIQNKVVANMKNEIDNALEKKLDINGNAATATKATQDSAGQQINTTYIKGLSINGKTITYTKGDGTTGTITTQDNNTTYSAGTGLSLSGTTFNHSNSVTAATAQGDTSKTLTFGDTFTIPTITYDAQGHITGKGTTTMTMPIGPVAKEGNPVSEIGIAGAGFSAETIFEPKQEGNGDPSPDNVRPISGMTSATLTRCGKNLMDLSQGYGYNELKPLNAPVGTPITFSLFPTDGASQFNGRIIYEDDTTHDFAIIGRNADNNIWHTYTITPEKHIKEYSIYDTDGSSKRTISKGMIEYGSTATTFEPYQGDTYTADFGQTVYGGTLDWLTGVLTVEWASVQFMPTEIAAYGSAGYSRLSANNLQPIAALSDFYSVCDRFKRNYVWQTDAEYYYVTNDFVFLFSNRWTTLEEAKTWFTDNPTIMVYKLATPTTIQLTPHDLHMLDGTNTVYSDGNTNYVIFNSGASSLGKAYELFFKKTDTISVSNGGTGATSASGARTNLEVPSKTGNGASGTWGISISGNAAAATKLENCYSSRPTSANLITDGSGGIINFKATSSMTTGKPASDGHIIHMFWDNTGGWDGQFYIPNSANYAPQYRFQNSGTWQSWINFLTSNNYTSYTVTKTGSGASGTWGISISGDAATSTLASYALKMQTYKQGSTTETYGTSYPLYAQWESSNVLKLKCDNFTVKTDTATKLATARTLTIGNTGKIFDGSENVSWSLSEIGAAAASHGTHVTNSTVQVFNRDTIGTSPNFDNPGVNGFFEVRITSETSGETGTKPFNSFGTFLNLRTPDRIAMLQLAAPTGGELMFRAKQAAGVTMSGVAWKTLLSSSNYTNYTVTKTGSGASGTWGISISGNAATATQLATARTIQTNLGSTSSASFNGTANITPGVTGTLAVANGGTGATSKSGARTNFGITSGTTLPSSGSSGDIFFLY